MPRLAKPAAPAAPELKEIPLGSILEPKLPARESMDPGKLEDLAASIKAMGGVVQPILVEQEGANFRIHAGQRRFLAARLAGMERIRAIVHPSGTVNALAITSHENAYREDLNPAEEALWLYRLLEGIPGQDVDKLCDQLRLRRAYVENRLLLLNGADDVFEALKKGEISMAVAAELNKYTDDTLRRMRLENAVLGGATARVVREWRLKDEQMAPFIGHALESAAPPDGEGPAEAAPDPMTCVICGAADAKHEMEILWIHRGCRRVITARPELLRTPPSQ